MSKDNLVGRLKALRKEKGLTWNRVGDIFGVSGSMIQKIIAGDTVLTDLTRTRYLQILDAYEKDPHKNRNLNLDTKSLTEQKQPIGLSVAEQPEPHESFSTREVIMNKQLAEVWKVNSYLLNKLEEAEEKIKSLEKEVDNLKHRGHGRTGGHR